MITVVQGRLGSGKSYEMVRCIMDHLNRGGCVRTNISLDYKEIGRALGRRLASWQIGGLSASDDPTTIPTGDRRGRGSRRTWVVLDEALNWFAADTESGKGARKTWGEWLRQSDKLGQDVFFIAQDFSRASKWIRELAASVWDIVPTKRLRIMWFIPAWIFFPPFLRGYFVRRLDCRTASIIGIEFHIYSPGVYRYYDTSETFGFVGARSAYEYGTLAPPFRLPSAPLVISLVFLVGAVILLIVT